MSLENFRSQLSSQVILIALIYTQTLKYEHLEVGCYDDTPTSARAKSPSKKSHSDMENVCYSYIACFKQ